jgi:hypothetical protein
MPNAVLYVKMFTPFHRFFFLYLLLKVDCFVNRLVILNRTAARGQTIQINCCRKSNKHFNLLFLI